MKNLLVRAFPVLPGQEAGVREFATTMRERSREADAFYSRFGVMEESWHLQQTPNGPLVIVLSRIDEDALVDTAAAYANPDEAFAEWFHEQVRTISGVDPREQPLGTPTECIHHFAPSTDIEE